MLYSVLSIWQVPSPELTKTDSGLAILFKQLVPKTTRVLRLGGFGCQTSLLKIKCSALLINNITMLQLDNGDFIKVSTESNHDHPSVNSKKEL